MKEEYSKPEINYTEYETIDILTTSSDDDDEGWTPWY